MSLETLALERFDSLLETGDLLWKDVQPRHFSSSPFDFEFRVAASLIAKPQDKEQKKPDPSKVKRGAFDDDNPLFEIGKIGARHRLILNKFSVVRPQFVLPTVEFEPQRDPLTLDDFAAVWEVLSGLSESYMAIFNCGVDAGSSVGHKHLQVIPLPERYEKGFLPVLLNQIKEEESKEEVKQDHIHSLNSAPFKHAAWHIPKDVTASNLLDAWNRLCKSVNISEGQAHNLLLTRDLLVAIPRPKAWMGEGDGEFSANAASMAGIVWCKTEEQYNAWMKFGPMEALREFGIDTKP